MNSSYELVIPANGGFVVIRGTKSPMLTAEDAQCVNITPTIFGERFQEVPANAENIRAAINYLLKE